MELYEIIIRAHVHVHAAELAVKSGAPRAAYDELNTLWDLFADDLRNIDPRELRTSESPDPEGS